jgi:WD40 repeat protein/tRNA A-37 threonylcarbamoyl transferase component Bud32
MLSAGGEEEASQSTVEAQAFPERPATAQPPAVKLYDDYGEKVTNPEPGRYEMREPFAAGGQARILLAFDEHIGREVAVKEFMADKYESQKAPDGSLPAVVRFLREARVTGQLEHPNIIPVHELGRQEDGSLYYTMRLVRGQTLEDKLENCGSQADRLKLLGVFWDACKAIAFAHSRGVVHRDIKPENVMVGEFGETVVLDWGIAKVTGKQDVLSSDIEKQVELLSKNLPRTTLTGMTIGTPAYMSPEQAQGRIGAVDERSDVWSLGAMLYEILTGIPPYMGPTPSNVIEKVIRTPPKPVRELAPEAPADLVAVTEKALQRDPTQRYQSAWELAEEVSAYMTGGRVQAYEYTAWELFKRFASRHKLAFGAVSLAFLVIIGALVAVISAYQSEQEGRRLANYHLAQAYAEKADRLLDDLRLPSARVFAAASLLYNPAHPQSPFYTEDFAGQIPQSLELMAQAASTIYRVQREDTLRLQKVLRSADLPFQIAYSPDGNYLAAACHDKSVRIWDADSGKLEQELSAHAGRVHGVAYSPDGRFLASASYDKTCKLWDVDSGTEVRTYSGHTDRVTRAVFSPDGKLLASASFDGTVRIWNVKSGEAIKVLKGHAGRVRDAAFSPDGKNLASSGVDKTVRVWDVESGKQLLKLAGHTNSVARLRYAPGGRWLASGGYDGKILLWDVATGKQKAVLEGHTGHVYSLAFSPDGAWLASGSFDTSLRIWDVATAKLHLRIHGHQAAVSGLAFSPDSKSLATCGYDRDIKIWNIVRGDQFPEFHGHKDKVYAMSHSPDGKLLATGSWDNTVRIWNAASGKRLRVLRKHKGYVNAVVISPDSGRLASTSWDGTVRAWDAKTGKQLYQLQGHGGLINPAVFSPDGNLLACGHGDRDIAIWEAQTGKLVRKLEGHAGRVYALAFAPDGKRLASASHDKTVKIWDPATGKVINSLQGHSDLVSGVDWSPDGRWIASSGSDNLAILWDAKGGKELRRFLGHHLWVNSVRFSPDSSLLATASDDRTVRIWSVGSGEPILIIRTHNEVMAIRFTPDGNTLALGDGKRVVMYPLDFSAVQTDPRAQLKQAERSLGKLLKGFQLKIAELPTEGKLHTGKK